MEFLELIIRCAFKGLDLALRAGRGEKSYANWSILEYIPTRVRVRYPSRNSKSQGLGFIKSNKTVHKTLARSSSRVLYSKY